MSKDLQAFFVWVAAWAFLVEPVAAWWANIPTILLLGIWGGLLIGRDSADSA